MKSDPSSDETKYTITMNTRDNHTYAAYQVFTGDLIINDDGKKTLSNIQWGTGVNGTELLQALKNDSTYGTKFTDCTNPIEVAEVLGTYADNGPDIEAIAKIIAAHTTTTKVTGDTKDAIKGLTAGYYLTLDETTTTDLPEGETISCYMLQVVDDVDVTAKDSTVSSVKKVQDINDSADSPVMSGLQDSADYDVGDDIPYTLKFTLPANYEKFDHYYVAFQDDMSKGLTYKTGSSKIQYGSGEEVVIDDPTAGTTTYSDGHMWIWAIMDLKALDAAKDLNGGAVITLTYKATLNADAVIGMEGNPNKLQVEYTSNPNNTGNGTEKPGETGKTPVDLNIVVSEIGLR